MLYDVAVIGMGVSGAMVARQLSRYNLNLVMLEKRDDVAMGATRANSAIVHAGYDAETGSLKAKLNVEGCAMMEETCRLLNVPYKNIGSLVVAYNDEDMQMLDTLMKRGEANGVPNMEIIGQDRLFEMEPNLSREAIGALWAPTAGIVCPYELTIAATECAIRNGATLLRNSKVTSIVYEDEVFTLNTVSGQVRARYVVNAAGTHSDGVAAMVGDKSFHIIPRKGEYYLLDKSEGSLINHVLFPCPSKMGKGTLVTKTVDGNVLVGPTAFDINDPDDNDTTPDGLEDIKLKSRRLIPSISLRAAITSFSGLRSHTDRLENDFVIGVSEKNPHFINVAGIESPGLSAAPAVGKYVAELLAELLPDVEPREDFDPTRPAPVRFRELDDEQRKALIEKDKRYGRIVCRCETVTEGEIIDAIHSPVGAVDMDGVKRRTRAGMGRCQSGFCGSKVVEILARELNKPVNEITKFGGTSRIIYEHTK